jgi:hypothetical protein
MSPKDEALLLQRVEDAIRMPPPDRAPTEDDDKTSLVGFVALLVWTFAVGGMAFVAGAAWCGAQVVGRAP